MTSNVGAKKLKDFGTGVGFGTKSQKKQEDENTKKVIEGALKKAFAPEFLNRVDDVIIFNALEKSDIKKIINIELDNLLTRIKKVGYNFTLSESAKDFIAEKGFDKQYGARPLKRALQKYIEDPLAEEILSVDHGSGSVIKIKMNKSRDVLEFDWTEAEKEKESKKSSDSAADEEAESKEEQTKA